ncbi:MAG: hypothetical protein ACREDX_05925 [Aestuariivirga sp.]
MPGLLDTVLIAAIVSAAVTALGWFASHWSETRLEAKRRDEKIVDVQTALLAEIESNLTRYEEIDLDGHMADMTRRILRKGRGSTFTPFVPRDAPEIVFEAMLPDIHILPTITIDDVVAYYKQEYKLRELVEDLRSDRYRELEQDRKAHLYEDYVWQIKTVLVIGQQARLALRDSLGMAPLAVNNPAADPNPVSENP